MANENKEIGEVVKKCKILLLDIEGTTTSISFVKDKLFPYAEENVKKFLENHWQNEEVKEAVNALRKLAIEDKEKSVEGVVEVPGEDASKDDQIEGLVNNVKWQMSGDRKSGPLKVLQGLIWKQGYDNGDIKGHVFNDVSQALEQWHSVDGQKVYIYSSGSVQAQKLLFGQSIVGDLLKYIDGHFDTAVGAKQESTSYTSIVEKIGCGPADVLFLTDILKEAEAARGAGLHVALVSREGNAALPAGASEYPVIQSLAQLTLTNKRKTDPQEGEQPTKIPKTEINNDPKSTVEDEKSEKSVSEANNETEKMEVEESVENSKEDGAEKPVVTEVEMQQSPAVVVEEITDEKDNNVPVSEAKPIVTEVSEDNCNNENKTDSMDVDTKTNGEAMETITKEDSIKNSGIKDLPSENGSTEQAKEKLETPNVPTEKLDVNKTEEPAIIPEKTTVITEIVEITNDKESTCDVANVIEGMEPIVEEPVMNDDIEELHNVGDVLEKECDEILSKVDDVTNLDNIPLKPLLNPIVEESMETENTDSNDIVDRILDTELELEMEKTAKANKSVEVAENNDILDVPKQNEVKSTINIENSVDSKTDIIDGTKDGKEEKNVEEENIEQTNVDSSSDKTTESAKEVLPETQKPDENVVTKSEITDSEIKSAAEAKPESAPEEKLSTDSVPEDGHVNGKTSNGETETKQNGDASNEEELKSRLSAENGKEIVNGSNGDSKGIENGLVEKTAETEVPEIKVKTVATEEPSKELIEQPTEA